jgi:hypothetical protein
MWQNYGSYEAIEQESHARAYKRDQGSIYSREGINSSLYIYKEAVRRRDKKRTQMNILQRYSSRKNETIFFLIMELKSGI